MLGILYYYQVPQMASQKTKAAGLKALVASFRRVGCPFCTSRLDACNCCLDAETCRSTTPDLACLVT